MSEPTGTQPFAPFEWMLSLRYLRARRREGFISVIAGFSFLGIMLGVATLIIVMAVMNGFRQELLDKILGLNGHLLIQPLEPPLTDWEAVAERISKVPGVALAAPIVEGQALASSPFNASGVLVRGIRARRPRQAHLDRQQHQAGHARRLRRRAGRRDRQPARRSAVAARGRQHHAGRAARRGDADGHDAAHQDLQGRGRLRDRHVGIRRRLRLHAAARGAGSISTAPATSPRSRSIPTIPTGSTATASSSPRPPRPADLHDRLAPAQRHLLQRAAGRAQRDVPDPDADRAGGGAQHHLRPDHAGEGQGHATSRILRTMGATQGAIMRVFLITGASIGVVGTLVGLPARR